MLDAEAVREGSSLDDADSFMDDEEDENLEDLEEHKSDIGEDSPG